MDYDDTLSLPIKVLRFVRKNIWTSLLTFYPKIYNGFSLENVVMH